MPCRDEPTLEEQRLWRLQADQKLTDPLEAEIKKLRSSLNEREAMLCAVLTSLEDMESPAKDYNVFNTMLSRVNSSESGVSIGALLEWWEDHKEADAERRHLESVAKQSKRQAILDRLTPEERDLLGVWA